MSEVNKKVIATITIDTRSGGKNHAIETRATFFSYDYKVGIFEINLRKDGQELELPEDVEIVISPRKLTGNPQKMVYTATEINHEESVVYWDFPEELHGYVGKIRVFVGIKYSDGKQMHGGYFNFNTDISEIDENIPEFSEIYWQSWNDFKEEAETYWQEWNQAQVDKQDQFVAETTERLDEFVSETNGKMSQLTDELTEAQDDIDQIQEDIASGKVVTETKLVDYWTGEPIVLEGVANFVGKTTGDVTGNPHYFGRNGATTGLVSPTGLWPEASQSQYANLEKLDGKVAVLDGRQDAGYYAQNINKWNLIEQINRDYPKLYESVGANDLAAKVAFVKKVITSFEMTAYGRGSGPTGNKVTSVIWNGAAWVYAHTTTAGTITKLGYRLTDPRFLNDDGFMYNLIYAEPSDGITPSSVSIDTAQLAYKLDLSMYEFVPGWQDRPMVYKDVLTGNFDWNSVKETGYYYVKNYTANTSSPPSFLKKTGLLVVHSVTDDEGIKIAQTYEPAGAVYSRNDEKVKRNTADGSFNNVNWSTDTGYWRDELVITHGEQTIGGIKNFTDTPLVNESPILVSNDTGWIQVPLNPGYTGWFFVRKRAGIITWQFYIGLGTNSAGPNSIVCTVPEGFRTSLNHTKVLGGNATTAPATAQVRVMANGNIAIWHTDTPGSMYSFIGDFGDYENPENI